MGRPNLTTGWGLNSHLSHLGHFARELIKPAFALLDNSLASGRIAGQASVDAELSANFLIMENLDIKNYEIAKARRSKNDLLRKFAAGGEIACTNGIWNLPKDVRDEVCKAVREFDDFTVDNDPYGEHDFGAITVQDHKVFWKIDYHDVEVEFPLYDAAPLDTEVPIMMIMLAEEY